jgi:hypothetical protein
MTAWVINWKGCGRKESQLSLQQYTREAKESHTKFILGLAKHKACKMVHLYNRMRECKINIALLIPKFPIGKDPEPVLSNFNAIYFVLLPFYLLLGLPMSIPSKNLY